MLAKPDLHTRGSVGKFNVSNIYSLSYGSGHVHRNPFRFLIKLSPWGGGGGGSKFNVNSDSLKQTSPVCPFSVVLWCFAVILVPVQTVCLIPRRPKTLPLSDGRF